MLLPLPGSAGPSVPPCLVETALTRRVTQGEVVIRAGDPEGRWWAVHRGVLVAETTSWEGKRSIVEVLGPGDLFGPPSLVWPDYGGLDGRGEDQLVPEVRAIAPSVLWSWDRRFLSSAGATDVRVATWVQERLLARLERTRLALARALTLTVPERVEAALRQLAVAAGQPVPGGTRIRVPISQETLAAASGASRESVSRALRSLAATGRVRRTGRLYVVTEPGETDRGPDRLGPPSPRRPA
ncbi:MAG: Crp/Fnr family transcriptional regulator [Actinomycetota bacterium]